MSLDDDDDVGDLDDDGDLDDVGNDDDVGDVDGDDDVVQGRVLHRGGGEEAEEPIAPVWSFEHLEANISRTL